ncbi:MAG: hypothetical protein AABX89_03800 [Candidatus Thermoplasmatota archaeon]
MNNHRIAGVTPVAHDGPYHETAIHFLDGTTIGMEGVIPTHPSAYSCGGKALPTDVVNFSVLRSKQQETFLNRAGHYGARMADVFGRVEATNPGSWRLVSARSYGRSGTVHSNRRLLHETWTGEGHALLVQPAAKYTATSIMAEVDALRNYQDANSTGYKVDVLAHVPFAGSADVSVVVDIVADEKVAFVDLRGTNPKVLGALSELRAQLALMENRPWLGATQVQPFCRPNKKAEYALAATQLNAFGIMAASGFLGGSFAGNDPNLTLANKKVWAQRGSSMGVARKVLKPSLSLAPQATTLDLADDKAVAVAPDFFEVYRNDTMVAGVQEATRFRAAIGKGKVTDFLTVRPELTP